MNGTKPDLEAMRRLLHGHQWTDILEWGQAFGALADLSDAQIDTLAAPECHEDDQRCRRPEKTR